MASSAALLTLRYASLEDVAQDLDMVIQSSQEGEWSWEGANTEEDEAWAGFVQDASSVSDASKVAGLAGRIQVTPAAALSFSLLSQSEKQNGPEVGAVVDVSAPALPAESVTSIKIALADRSKHWAEEGVESLFLFDLLTTAQTLLADLPAQAAQPTTADTPSASAPAEPVSSEPTTVELSRALFWSHHLKAPSKLKDFNNWCPELRVWGIVRTGYPGYLCFEGEPSAVDEIIRRVKGLQWHAIQLRVHHSWTWTGDKEGVGALERALLSCALAKGHPDNASVKKGGKVRTGCEVVEDLGELVERLKACGLEQEEISEALGIRISGNS